MLNAILNNRYRLDAELGRGGRGIVYRAYDTLFNRPVALKVLNTAGLGTAGKARLLAEARAAAGLNHPNIVSVYDAGEAEGVPFIVMELVEGPTLRAQPSEGISPQKVAEARAALRELGMDETVEPVSEIIAPATSTTALPWSQREGVCGPNRRRARLLRL